jgi:hypothetical protein
MMLCGAMAILVTLFLVIDHYIHNCILAVFITFGGLIVALYEALLFRRIPRWIDFVMKDPRNLRSAQSVRSPE